MQDKEHIKVGPGVLTQQRDLLTVDIKRDGGGLMHSMSAACGNLDLG
jgi:hypothetical protein